MTQRFKRLSHSIYECKYHGVFCPKYRYRIFKDEVDEYSKQQIYELCRQKDLVEVLELNVQPDHVHLIVSIPPKYAVSEFMGYRCIILKPPPLAVKVYFLRQILIE